MSEHLNVAGACGKAQRAFTQHGAVTSEHFGGFEEFSGSAVFEQPART